MGLRGRGVNRSDDQGRHRSAGVDPSRRPRVLVLRHDAHRGGMGRAAEFFTPLVGRYCQVVDVVSLSADRHGSSSIEASWAAKLFATTRCLAGYGRSLCARRPEAVYLPIAQSGIPLVRDLVIVLLARARGSALVLHLHGSQLPARMARHRLLRSALAGSHWIVLSDTVADRLRASGVPAGSVAVVRNPAPPARDLREQDPRGRRLRVGWLGTMHRLKGFDIVCDAVGELKDRGYPVTYAVAGMRSDVPDSRSGLIDRDLGVLDPGEVSGFWATVDVFVLPARWEEGLPFVLLEALQAGCVVAGSWAPGAAELFSQGCVETVTCDTRSVTAFLVDCVADLDAIRDRQQKAWRELRESYDPFDVQADFAAFWHRFATRR
jgi:glycosyltransferase involved in cell wall biosynthesis